MLIAIEAGTHSPWVSRLLERCGYKVLVAKTPARRGSSMPKDARLTVFTPRSWPAWPGSTPSYSRPSSSSTRIFADTPGADPLPRSPGTHQSKTHQPRAVRGQAVRPPPAKCSAQVFHRKVSGKIPEALKPALEPILRTIEELTARTPTTLHRAHMGAVPRPTSRERRRSSFRLPPPSHLR